MLIPKRALAVAHQEQTPRLVYDGPSATSWVLGIAAPGTGTPVPGGLTTYEVQRIFRALKIKNLVGCDTVELSPPYDHVDITAMAAVDAIFEMLCLFQK